MSVCVSVSGGGERTLNTWRQRGLGNNSDRTFTNCLKGRTRWCTNGLRPAGAANLQVILSYI